METITIITIITTISTYAGIFLLSAHVVLIGSIIFLAYKKKLRTFATLLFTTVVLFEAFTVSVITILQYLVWSAVPETQALVSVPLENSDVLFWIHAPIQAFVTGTHGYYILYAYTHWWLPLLTALAIAFFITLITCTVRYFRPLLIQKSDILLSTTIALLAVRIIQIL